MTNRQNLKAATIPNTTENGSRILISSGSRLKSPCLWHYNQHGLGGKLIIFN
jgi:hypothetical protein